MRRVFDVTVGDFHDCYRAVQVEKNIVSWGDRLIEVTNTCIGLVGSWHTVQTVELVVVPPG